MSRIPFRGPDNRQPLTRGPAQPLGFVSTIQGKLAELKRDVAGLRDRMKYRYGEGVPASYIGTKEFFPEAQTFDLDVFSEGEAEPSNVQPVQYVVRDGVDHSVPIQLFAPGVFVLRYVTLSFWQRYNDPTLGAMRLPIPIGKSFFFLDPSSTAESVGMQTIKWHLFYDLTWGTILSDRMMGTNLMWNISDPDSDRPLCDDWMPHTTLLPQHYQNLVDGDLSEFEVPWTFERAGVVDFRFRLINPILQLAAAATVFPFNGRSDLINGTRNMSVLVRAELHGRKFYSNRDLLLREAV